MTSSRCLVFHKCCLLLTTFLIAVLGLGLVCGGLWIRLYPEFRRYIHDADDFNFLYAGAYVIICVGVVVFVVAVLGSVGAFKNNVCIIVTFFIALLILFSVYTTMLTAGILAVLQKHTLMQLLGDALKELLSKFYEDAPSKQLMLAIQTQFNCCGADKGISDYVLYTGRKNHPEVCLLELFGQPCNAALVDYIEKNAFNVYAVAAAVAVTMLIGLVQSIFLCHAVRDLHSRTDQNGGTGVVVTSSSLHEDIKMADDDDYRRSRQLPQSKQPKQKSTQSRAAQISIDR